MPRDAIVLAAAGRGRTTMPDTQKRKKDIPKGGSKTKATTSPPLWKRVSELGASSAFLLYLSEVGSDRLSLTQAAFFLIAATADAAGKPASRIDIINTHEETFRGSIRNSYRQLMPPSRLYPNGLGWLEAEVNPMDSREQILRLSEKGKAVIEGALLTLEPIVAPYPKRDITFQ